MAIVEMKKLTLIAMKRDRERLLRQMQKLGCVHVVEETGEAFEKYRKDENARLEDAKARVAKLEQVIARLMPFDTGKHGMFVPKPVADADALDCALADENGVMRLVDEEIEIEREINEDKAREVKEAAAAAAWSGWRDLAVPLEEIRPTAHTIPTLVTVPERAWPELEQELLKADIVPAYEVVSKLSGNVNLLIVSHGSVFAQVDALLKKAGGITVSVANLTGTPEALIAAHERVIGDLTAAGLEREKRLREMAVNLLAMRLLYDAAVAERDEIAVGAKLGQTESALFLTGWVPAGKTAMLEKALREITSALEIEFAEPAAEETPPTLLHNGKLIYPFEAVINLYSLPNYRGYDATTAIAPFFACFFGMMVSDAGYGLVLMALSVLYYLLKRPKYGKMGQMDQIMSLAFWGGLGTVVWGILYGGWFGVSVTPVLVSPLNQPVETMAVCILSGYIHLLFGLGIGVYMGFRSGHPFGALIDQGSWMLMLLSAPLIYFPQTKTIGLVLLIIGVAALLLFTGRGKKNPFKRLLSGAGKLYDVTSYLSDLLSYVRLFGMGLSTGVIGMVVNMMANMMMGSPVGFVFGCLVLVIGHAFNLGINALGAYVNACRLQYIEFFSKFYEDGGYAFAPLCYKTKYVDYDAASQGK